MEDIMDEKKIENNIAKIAFLFISFAIISGGYVTQVLPCQTQKFMENNIIAKHIIGILISFLFIMMEGGWSFDMEEQKKAQVDWTNGNAIDSLIFGTVLYFIFLLTSKMKLIPNLILYGMLFLVYLINSQRMYWKNRKIITKENNEKMLKYIYICLIISTIVFVYGIIDYIIYKIEERKKDFRIIKFIIGSNKCNSLS
tara:strand:- start:211 stop:804 length:594 start_codon:yes stop_codon:yes gene_type:complete